MTLEPERRRRGAGRVRRLYRHLGRAREVTAVLARFGFEDLLERLGLVDILDRARNLVGLKNRPEALGRPERARLAMESLGLVFIKLGQYLSTRGDLIPEAYLKEFAKLQNAVPPMPFAEFKGLTADLLETGEIAAIDPAPLAAASVGQVHGAVLADGRAAVIKAMRPGLKNRIRVDLEILGELAELLERHLPALSAVKPRRLAAEFSRSLRAELDFGREALNLERFGRFYAKRPRIHIPRLFRPLSGDRILVMERVEGLKIDDTAGLQAAGFNFKALAAFVAETALEQILTFGYFHADPHPGNLLIQPGPRLAFLDFGQVGRLNREVRETLLDLALAASRRQAGAAVKALLKLAVADPEEPPDRERLEAELELFLEAHLTGALKDLNLGLVFRDMIDIAAQYRLTAPPDMLLLLKALTQFESLIRRLDPDFDIWAAAKPFIIARYRRRLSPAYWGRRFRFILGEAADFLSLLPGDLKPFYQMLRGGRLKSDFALEGMEYLRLTLDRASYRLSFALVLAALLVASAVMVHAQAPPLWHNLPVFGLLGFLGAAVVGFWLLFDFLKNHRF